MKPAAKKNNTKAAKKPSLPQKTAQPARKKTATRKKTTIKTVTLPAVNPAPVPHHSQKPVLHRRPLLVYPK
jgi:hypothetical protein